jgi:hypothetical protein
MTMPANDRPNKRLQEHLTDAELNELVDGSLSPTETGRANAHMQSCADCTERYQTLLATGSALQAAPSLMPRRSFQLSPEQAKIPEKQPSWFDRFANWIVPGVPAVRAATLAVALLLISVTAIDVLTHQSNDSENAGPIVMRQAEPTQPGEQPPLQANNALPTSLPSDQEAEETGSDSSTGGGAEPTQQIAQSSGGAAQSEQAAPEAANDTLESSDSASSEQQGALGAAADSGAAESQANEAPVAPAAAVPPTESTSGALDEAPQTMMGAAPPASASPSVLPTATATASPVPATPTAAATPPPAESTSGDRGVDISRWRIAEFGLLLLLLWLGVTWFGRTRMHDEPKSPDSD